MLRFIKELLNMASMKYHKDVKRWRVFWHVTLPDGTVDKGSKSFKDKALAQEFKVQVEKRAKQIKKTIFVEAVFLDDAVEQWKDFCLGYTEPTRYLYILLVEKFIEFLDGEVVYISDLETSDINTFLNSLMRRQIANSSVNNSLTSIKSLCKYMSENYKIANPAQGIKKLKEGDIDANYWTMEEYRKVLMKSPEFARRWIRFIACTGLRASEFCNLRWRNCDLDRRTVTVVGKGRKRRTIGLNDIAVEILEEIKDGREIDGSDVVFLNRGEPMTRQMLNWYIRQACQDTGLRGGGPHAARHFFATQLLLGGIPIIKVSALLGHSSISTTQRHYSHILSPDLSDVTSVLKAI
jgi:site-specific recombinase XerD